MPKVKLDVTKRSGLSTDFESSMARKIVGQDEALQKTAEIYQLYCAGLQHPGRPIGNLLFLGPTGTGKTRVVEAMAESLYNDPRACIKVDCAEFQHSHEIAKLIGSPPGYLGHRETHPVLTQEALNAWHNERYKISLILFDEIEKASDALWQLLLGIMDKATLTLGDNRRVDFSNALIIMTSNLGAAEMQESLTGGFGFQAQEKGAGKTQTMLETIAVNAARRKFTPEFMNRIDKTVVFHLLEEKHLREVLNIELGRVQQRVLATDDGRHFVIHCSPKFKDFLMVEGTDDKYGARHLKRAIEKHLVQPLASLLATGQIEKGDVVTIAGPGDFYREPGAAMAACAATMLPGAGFVDSRR